MMLLSTSTLGAWAQPYPSQGAQSVCLTGVAEPYGVINTIGSTYAWSVIGGATPADWVLTSTNTNLVTVLWKTAGTYTVQVIETSAAACAGSPVTVVVTVNPLPVVALAGPSPVCLNSIGNVYTTDAGMTNYAWTIVGGTITAGGAATDNTVTVTWNGVGPYSVSVNYNNLNGCTATNPTILPVTVNPLPVVALTGPSPVCLNSIGNVYTTDAGMTNYVWTIVGGTKTAGGTATDNTVTVTWNGVGPYSVSVNYNNINGCTATNPTVLPVTVNPLPVVALTGPSPVCLNSVGNVYSTDAGMTNYAWTIVGGTKTAGGAATDNTVTVTWNGVGPYSVSVNYNNLNGCTATNPTVLPVTVNPLPATSPIYHN